MKHAGMCSPQRKSSIVDDEITAGNAVCCIACTLLLLHKDFTCSHNDTMLFTTVAASLLALSSAVFGSPVELEARNNGKSSSDVSGPTPPQLKWLYTAYVYYPANLLDPLLTPAGIRKEIPIIGGNFTGPGINGKFRDLGADWGTVSRVSAQRSEHSLVPTIPLSGNEGRWIADERSTCR